MTPPRKGPNPLPHATAAPIKPLYLPRCRSVVTSLAIIWTKAVLRDGQSVKGGQIEEIRTKTRKKLEIVAKNTRTHIQPPPKPLIARKVNSMPAFCEKPLHRLPMARIPRAMSKICLRPKISLRRPLICSTSVRHYRNIVLGGARNICLRRREMAYQLHSSSSQHVTISHPRKGRTQRQTVPDNGHCR